MDVFAKLFGAIRGIPLFIDALKGQETNGSIIEGVLTGGRDMMRFLASGGRSDGNDFPMGLARHCAAGRAQFD